MAISADSISSMQPPAATAAVFKDSAPFGRGSLDAERENNSLATTDSEYGSDAPHSAPLPEIPALYEEVTPASPETVHFPTRARFVNGINQARRKRAASHAPTRSTPRQPTDEEHAYARRASLPVFFSSSFAAKAAEEPATSEETSRVDEEPAPSDTQADAALQRHSESEASAKPSRRGRFFRSIFGRH